ncbi:DUF2586 family protein [Tenacibaculum jejuense]|uniref:Tail sheath protein n=1 Tax=Tenacibaculum jejuense TaxID=584609 RepID=A0A238UBI4_9FLAO|nr:DUF2586 family protein [Tenacibaculum jejuense]SNR16529.1 conserved protein of unknown function [Tenacibaculum jejuense]
MNGLPKVKINVNNDGLGQVAQTEDGVSAMILTGVSVVDGAQIGKSFQVFSLDEAEAAGITADDNPYAYKHVKQFYEEAGNGTQLWLMLVADTVSMEDMVSADQDFAKKLLDDAKGAVRLIAVSRESSGTVTLANGVDEDVDNAVTKAQTLIKGYASKYKEASVIIDGKDFNGTVGDLKDYTESDKEFVSILLANTDGGKNAAVGLLLGRLAKDPVMRNPGRVKSGSLPATKGYFTNEQAIEELENAWDNIHDKGYIFLRSFVGRSGYFFNDAPTCTNGNDDLNNITRVRTIYKARRVAYDVFVNEILDEIPLEANGKIAPALIKSWEGLVDNAINLTMTQNGEISAVRTSIDPAQDVLATNEVKVSLDILPVGYAKYITVELGFTTSLS